VTATGELITSAEEIQIMSARSTVQIDNEQVRAIRWTLAAGDQIDEHLHEHPYVVVPLASGDMQITTSAGERTSAEMVQGVSYHREAGARHTIRNAGTGVLDFVEIEILASIPG
jgi:quercetin dioxygenase-like cupin family protein